MVTHQIEMAAVTAIVPDEDNVNTHSAEQIGQIAASIRDFGFNDPIAVDQNNVIVEGHGRLLAALRMGLTEVPILRLTFNTPEERKAYAIAHNRTQQLTQVDEKIVLNEFDRIGLTREQYAATGFTEDDVLFMRIRQEQDEADAAAPSDARFAAPKAPTTKLQFSGQERMFSWLAGMDWLRERYPDAITTADRMTAFMAEFGEAL